MNRLSEKNEVLPTPREFLLHYIGQEKVGDGERGEDDEKLQYLIVLADNGDINAQLTLADHL